MKVTISIETLEELFRLLHKYDASTETVFVQELSTNDKYEILALIMMVRGKFEDFEDGFTAAKSKIEPQNLTKYFLERSSDNWQTLHCEFQDVIAIYRRHGWEYFELMQSDDTGEDEDENKYS